MTTAPNLEDEFEITLTREKMEALKDILEFYAEASLPGEAIGHDEFAAELAKEIEEQGIK